jgi:hypothetical protein
MPAVTVLSLIALVFAIIAAVAVTVASLQSYLLARRWQRLADQIGRTVEGEFKQALVEVAEAARGVRKSAGNVDHALTPLAGVFNRLEGLAATLTVETLVGALVPALTKATGWLSVVRHGLGQVIHGRSTNGPK